jgi:hypothetical protein
MIDRNYGYIKDRRDERDYLFQTRKAVELPDVVGLSEYLPPVRNQGQQGFVCRTRIGGIITGKAIQLGVFEEWESPRWIYYGGRYIGGYVNQDCGTERGLPLNGVYRMAASPNHFGDTKNSLTPWRGRILIYRSQEAAAIELYPAC